MKVLFIAAIILHLAAINFAYLDLDTTTTAASLKPAKNAKYFAKIDLSRDETINGKNKPDDITTRAADLMPPRSMRDTIKETTPKMTSSTEKLSTPSSETPSPTPAAAAKTTGGNKSRWFFAGAGAGIIVSLIAMYVYDFYKTRSESTYQNL